MNVGANAGAIHAAFVSYSHKDADAARRLHRPVGGHRLPRRLAGTAGAHGSAPAGLSPVFPSQEELPAAGDLSETARAALHRALFAKQRRIALVAREIFAFREVHPYRSVLAAIVSAEPCDCFPPF